MFERLNDFFMKLVHFNQRCKITWYGCHGGKVVLLLLLLLLELLQLLTLMLILGMRLFLPLEQKSSVQGLTGQQNSSDKFVCSDWGTRLAELTTLPATWPPCHVLFSALLKLWPQRLPQTGCRNKQKVRTKPWLLTRRRYEEAKASHS